MKTPNSSFYNFFFEAGAEFVASHDGSDLRLGQFLSNRLNYTLKLKYRLRQTVTTDGKINAFMDFLNQT
jgi:hypothetical protein